VEVSSCFSDRPWMKQSNNRNTFDLLLISIASLETNFRDKTNSRNSADISQFFTEYL
jgi:hypothetical protein